MSLVVLRFGVNRLFFLVRMMASFETNNQTPWICLVRVNAKRQLSKSLVKENSLESSLKWWTVWLKQCRVVIIWGNFRNWSISSLIWRVFWYFFRLRVYFGIFILVLVFFFLSDASDSHRKFTESSSKYDKKVFFSDDDTERTNVEKDWYKIIRIDDEFLNQIFSAVLLISRGYRGGRDEKLS